MNQTCGTITDPRAVVVFRSTDCGSSWTGTAITVGGDATTGHELDHPTVVVDSEGHVHVAIRDFTAGSILVARSSDDGVSFGTPVQVSPSGAGANFRQVIAAFGSPASGGFLVVLYAQSFASPLGANFRRIKWWIAASSSPDAYSDPAVIHEADVPRLVTGVPIDNDPRAPLIIGTNGHCIAAFPYWNSAQSAQHIRVLEGTAGGSWTQVFDTAALPNGRTQHDAFFPVLARNDYNPGDQHVFLAWYDTRNDAANTPGRLVDVVAASSTNDALISPSNSWDSTAVQLNATSFEPNPRITTDMMGNVIKRYWGEYFGAHALSANASGGTASYLVGWMTSAGLAGNRVGVDVITAAPTP